MDCDETCDCCCDGIGGSVPFIPENAFCQTDSGDEEPCVEVVDQVNIIAGDDGDDGEGGNGGSGGAVPVTASSAGQGGAFTGSAVVDSGDHIELSQDVGTPAWALVLLLVVAACLTTIAYRNLTSEEQS